MASKYVEAGGGAALKKVCLLAGLIVVAISLLLVGTIYVRAWAGERRENVTFREIAKSNAKELERRERLLDDSREREAAFLARERERRDALANLSAQALVSGAEPCEIQDSLWELLEAE